MRTTITLEDSLLRALKRKAGDLKIPFKTLVNQILRDGLEELDRKKKVRKSCRVKGKSLQPRPGYDLDRIHKIFEQEEAFK